MWNYGGLCKKILLIFWVMMIGIFVIIGVGIFLIYIGFVGFLLKDVVIESVWVGNSYVFWMLVIVVCFISFYLWWLIFLIFFGKECGDYYVYEYVYESLVIMIVLLGILVIGVIFVGMVWYKFFFGDYYVVVEYFYIVGVEYGEVGDEVGYGEVVGVVVYGIVLV